MLDLVFFFFFLLILTVIISSDLHSEILPNVCHVDRNSCSDLDSLVNTGYLSSQSRSERNSFVHKECKAVIS